MAEVLSFYDLKAKKKFTTDKYTIQVKGNTRMAYATAPSGIKAVRIVGKV